MEKSIHSARYALLLELLVQARRGAGLTQEQLADRLSIKQSAVSKVERGERRLDAIELYVWCRAIGHSFKKFTFDLEKRLDGKN